MEKDFTEEQLLYIHFWWNGFGYHGCQPSFFSLDHFGSVRFQRAKTINFVASVRTKVQLQKFRQKCSY